MTKKMIHAAKSFGNYEWTINYIHVKINSSFCLFFRYSILALVHSLSISFSLLLRSVFRSLSYVLVFDNFQNDDMGFKSNMFYVRLMLPLFHSKSYLWETVWPSGGSSLGRIPIFPYTTLSVKTFYYWRIYAFEVGGGVLSSKALK